MNIPVYQLPSVATQSMRQQSLYQQTYLDRNRMITDVVVQEHVSHTTWALAPPPPPTAVIIPGSVNCPMTPQPAPVAAAPAATHLGPMAYVPMPNIQYYAAVSASMNAYGQGQVYSTRASTSTASCNMAGFYVPHYYQGGSSSSSSSGGNGGGAAGGPQPTRPPTASNGTQAQAQPPPPSPPKRTCDVATQVNWIPDEVSEVETLPVSEEETRTLDSSESSLDNSAAGDGLRIHPGIKRNSEVTLHQQRLHDITTVSLQGCEIAERLANTHRNRPCFKKIDTLCGRLKQDLLRPDGVLANINSQGIAWAVKDFIFVFTRIVNAWVIMKGYVYNTPDGLNKIKDELPTGFMGTFDSWQTETLALVEMIIKSFVNLDELLLKQKNSFVSKDLTTVNNSSSIWSFNDSNESTTSCKKNNCIAAAQGIGPSASSSPIAPGGGGSAAGSGIKSLPELDEQRLAPATSKATALYKPKSGMSLNYLYTMIEDSEETQRNVDANGTYLKTGTYQPLQKETLKQIEMAPPPKMQPKEQHVEPQWPWKGAPSTKASVPTPAASEICQGTCRAQLDRHIDARGLINPFSLIKRDVTRQLSQLSAGILELQHLDHFFQKQFTRNYYPDFFQRCQDDFVDIRAIVLQCESASYNHLYHAIHDLRRITFVVRCYLQIYSDVKLQEYIELYEKSVNEMLSKPPHKPNQYDHIMGRPGEKLFNYQI